jgi:hypothetical protein
LTGFISPYLNEQKEILKKQAMPFNFVSECLKILEKDASLINDVIQFPPFSMKDRLGEIAETTIRGQLLNSMIGLYK